MRIAITRDVSPSIAQCELTHLEREPISFEAARAQHEEYVQCLAALGCEVRRLPAEPSMPDAVFVEDTAIVLDEVAVIARPGAASRRPETASIAKALEPHRALRFIEAPATIDGGDVLRVGTRLFVGMTSRSTSEGIAQLREFVAPFGYTVTGVPVTGCLHLKTAVTQVAPDLLLINPAYVDPHVFNMRYIEVDSSEPFGGNALLIDETVIYPAAFPRTRRRMEQAGIAVQTVDASELAKAEGGVTCCSLVFETA